MTYGRHADDVWMTSEFEISRELSAYDMRMTYLHPWWMACHLHIVHTLSAWPVPSQKVAKSQRNQTNFLDDHSLAS